MAIRINGPTVCKPYIRPAGRWQGIDLYGINRISYGVEGEFCTDWLTSQDPAEVARVITRLQQVVPLGFVGEFSILCPAQRLYLLDEAGKPMDGINGEQFSDWMVLSGVIETGDVNPLEDVIAHELTHRVCKQFLAGHEAEFHAITGLPQHPNTGPQWEIRSQELMAEYISTALWGEPLDPRMIMQFGERTPEVMATLREWVLNLVGDHPQAEVVVVQPPRSISLTIGSAEAVVNGETVTLEVPAVIRAGRTCIPLRATGEALGAEVTWDERSRQIRLRCINTTVTMTVDNRVAWVQGEAKLLDVAPWIKQGRTLVPVRFLAEAFGFAVAWDNATRTVSITR